MEGVNCPSHGLNNNKKIPSPNTLISFYLYEFTVLLWEPPSYTQETLSQCAPNIGLHWLAYCLQTPSQDKFHDNCPNVDLCFLLVCTNLYSNLIIARILFSQLRLILYYLEISMQTKFLIVTKLISHETISDAMASRRPNQATPVQSEVVF